MKNFSMGEPMYYMPPGLFEYILIVSPAKDVYDRVMEEKQHFSRSYNQQVAVKAKPHIAISNFLAWENMEEAIVRWLQRITREQKSFCLTLNNYSGLPCHTVFLRIQDAAPLRELAERFKAIAPYIKEKNCPPARVTGDPHVSIARRLPAEVYEAAIREYSEREFHASFQVTELTLLRRKHQYDECKETAVFPLQPNESNN